MEKLGLEKLGMEKLGMQKISNEIRRVMCMSISRMNGKYYGKTILPGGVEKQLPISDN